jgi:7-cyano-7-deazaguanine synthase
MKKKAIVLLSGGLDSATCLGLANAQGLECYALSFDYGQRHAVELQAAKRIAANQGVVKHETVTLDLSQFGGSALTDTRLKVPDYSGSHSIPITYVPARNTVFLSIALAWAELLSAHEIHYGASSVDFSGYPDCRPEYFAAFQAMAVLATKAAVEGNPCEIKAPLMHLSKAETIKAGIAVGVAYHLTISCYQSDPEGRACGRCDSCYLRRKGFEEANISDPTSYQ